jgi:glycosyltransferase involved in cell wall biosynthesis
MQTGISVIIPVRDGGSPRVTLESLARQSFTDFEVIVSWDHGCGANAARNDGFRRSTRPLVLFSDDDIRWRPDALAILRSCLLAEPAAAYAYGAYSMDGRVQCDRVFDPVRLRRGNYISTMSLIRREAFPGWDESIRRLQDWDLWLTMLAAGRRGVYCGTVIFDTDKGNGITYGNDTISWEDANRTVRQKHGL